jgi:hypothetical protein
MLIGRLWPKFDWCTIPPIELMSIVVTQLDEKDFILKLKKDSLKFEEKLKETVSSPLKRAEERRDFYQKQREMLEDRNVNRLELERREQTKFHVKDRVFDAFGDQTYHGPIIPPNFEAEEKSMKKFREESQEKRDPIYIDANGKLYDINYLPIKLDQELLETPPKR